MDFLSRAIIACALFLTSTQVVSTPFTIPNSETLEIQDSSTKASYPVYIQLPKSYKNSVRNYPVVYLTDGPLTFPLATSAVKFPMNTGKMDEVIFVGIAHEKGINGMDSRVKNFTPYKANSWRRQTGSAEQYIAFLKQDVMSYINKNYRTLPTQNTYFGNSLGGLLGGYILLNHPNLFENYVLGSPSFWFNDNKLLKKEDFNKLNKLERNKRVFIAIGARETKAFDSPYNMVEDAKLFSDKLKPFTDRIDSELLIIPYANHDTAYPTAIAHGLYWLYKTK